MDSESLSTLGKSAAVRMRSGVIGPPNVQRTALKRAGNMTLARARDGLLFSDATSNQSFRGASEPSR